MPDTDEYTTVEDGKIGVSGRTQTAYIVCPDCGEDHLVNETVTSNSILKCPACRTVYAWRPAVRRLDEDEIKQERERRREELQRNLASIAEDSND